MLMAQTSGIAAQEADESLGAESTAADELSLYDDVDDIEALVDDTSENAI